VSDDFLESACRDLAPGKVAVIAEMAEEWNAPLDTRMSQIGGKVQREWKENLADDML
jgi:hypothetical protein